ncbi:MAG: FHA domain-containing protein [Myxococcota bacterium]
MFTLIIEDKHGGIADEYSFEEGEFYIGRSHTSDIILPSDNVSRRHARLYTVDGKCYIEDLNSSNGVFVNGRRIHEVFQIQRSAQVKVGDYYLHIESDAEAAADEEKTFCRLVGRNLAFANQVFRVQRKVNLIGRGKDCTLTIIDPSVSRIHSKLSVERSGALTLEDLKSSNGTFVNDERIEVATVQHRDIIRFGNVEFLVEVADQEATQAPPAGRGRDKGGRGDDRDRDVRRAAPAPVTRDRDSAFAGDDEYEARPAARGRLPGWVLPLAIGGIVALLAVIILIAFKNEIFGSKAPEVATTTAPATSNGPSTGPGPAPTTAPPAPTVDDKAKEEAKKKKEVAAILEVGKEYIKNQQWDQALERYNAVLEIDPINEEAKTAKNRIIIWKGHRDRLEEARKLANQTPIQRGKAAAILRDIDESSEYYAEAREELSKLLAAKPTIQITADNLVRQKDCTGALEQLKEARLIDPFDQAIGAKVAEIEAMVGTKKCAK